jgi:hypothetical protein
MQRLTSFLFILLCGIIALAGCKSPDLPSQVTYNFTNKAQARITLDMYGSKTDYGTNSNRLERYVLEPGATQSVPLPVGAVYWLDWYNDDYSINNLERHNNVAKPWPEMPTADVGTAQVNLSPNLYRDTIRSVLFNNTGTASTWKGTFSAGTPWDGTREFVIRKDMTAEMTYTSVNGTVRKDVLRCQIDRESSGISGTNSFGLFMDNPDHTIQIQLFCILYGSGATGRNVMEVDETRAGASRADYVIQRQ